MVHAQAAHMLNIYELGVPNSLGNCSSRPQSPRDNTTPDKVTMTNEYSYQFFLQLNIPMI